MTEMVLGRCEFEEGPESVEQSGDVLTISGDLVCATYAELTMRRLQLNGMVNNPDEDVFPCTFVAMPELDGFYAVESVSVGSTPVMTAAPIVPYSVTLRRVLDSHAPRVEVTARLVLRTNVHGITSAFMSDSDQMFRSLDVEGWTQPLIDYNRTADDGTRFGTLYVGTPAQFIADPATHYKGVPRVEVKASDGVWYPVRIMPDAAVGDVRLNNGLMRLSFTSAGLITMEHWDGSAWVSTQFRPSIVNTSARTPLSAGSVTILKSSLDVASMRARLTVSDGSSTYTIAVTLALNTGDRYGTVTILDEAYASTIRLGYVLVPGGGLTATAGSGGMWHTTNNANGNRPVLGCANGSGATGSGIWTGTTRRDTFMVGCAIGGGSATANNTTSDLLDQFFYTPIAMTRVVAR